MQPWGGGPTSSDGRSLEGFFPLIPLAGSPGASRLRGSLPKGLGVTQEHITSAPSPLSCQKLSPCNVVTHGRELLCPHSLGLRKCLWNELLIGKCFYPRSCMPGRASLWPRLTGTTHILHTPSLPPSLPPQPWGPLPFSFSLFWGRGGGNSRLTFLPDSGSTTQSRLWVLSSGAPFVLLRDTSFSPRSPGHRGGAP